MGNVHPFRITPIHMGFEYDNKYKCFSLNIIFFRKKPGGSSTFTNVYLKSMDLINIPENNSKSFSIKCCKTGYRYLFKKDKIVFVWRKIPISIGMVSLPLDISSQYLMEAKKIFLAKHENNRCSQISLYRKALESRNFQLMTNLDTYFNIPRSELPIILPIKLSVNS